MNWVLKQKITNEIQWFWLRMPVSLHKMTGLTMTLKTLIMTNRLNLFIWYDHWMKYQSQVSVIELDYWNNNATH